MKILVIGSGGREHAIIWKLKQNKSIDKIYCAPGNGGISSIATCVPIGALEIDKLVLFAKENNIDLTVVGMDDPLVMGVVDEFEKNGLMIFGPRKNAAIIEGSKAFSKELMKKYNIPTAAYEVFTDYDEALLYLKGQQFPVVVKADGLALGKGVLICDDFSQALEALNQIMIEKKFGASGDKVVIEEFITGHEVSVLSFCDGKTIVPMVSAQDHKRALDNDLGLNTGGMGTFSPSRVYTDDIAALCMDTIFKPTVNAMRAEGREFIGILYFGLMLTKNGPYVLEYNARFGDPETQVILPRLDTDLLDIIQHCINQTLDEIEIKWLDNACVCVILASGGYPEKYDNGFEICGLDKISENDDMVVFHAGTKLSDGKFLTNGGRVLGITGIGNNLDNAIKKAYEGVSIVEFDKKQYRKDIGWKI